MEGWRNFDDEHVSSLSQDKDLVRSDAYVLFYRHRHLPVPANFSLDHQQQQSEPSPVFMDTYEDIQTPDSSTMQDIIDFVN